MSRDLILLYGEIGRAIVEKQRTLGWGKSAVEVVSADLRRAFPGTTVFSPRSLRDRKRFYLTYAARANWPQDVANLGAEEGIGFLQQLAAEIQLSTLPKIFPLEKIVPGMLNPKMIEDKAKS